MSWWNPFSWRQNPDLDLVKADETPDPIAVVQETLDLLNEQIQHLPRGVRPWINWDDESGYPQLYLKRTVYKSEVISR